MRKKILIIDDEKKIGQLLAVNFTGEGYEVDIAFSGEQGLEKIDAFMPDLIILDIRLPGIDGWEICRKVKTSPKYRDMLVIISTASAQKFDKEKSEQVGADDFWGKPFEIDDVTGKTKELFERRAKNER